MASPTTSPIAAPGTTSLPTLIASMAPTLDPTNTTYVFAQMPHGHLDLHAFLSRLSDLKPQMLFREDLAWTLIVPRSVAEREGFDWTFPCKMVTLTVHSSLEAVGFLAKVTTRLAERVGTGVNPVSGFFNDHLFVPEGLEGRVMEELEAMSEEERARK